ncbi:hypothetical protein KBC04_00395 [Candidatus Babeliales bacterium]|nr:hypothetical protein [Candidatus Babeliales bacterium]MBP9843449.1 hypothetical protein [Candidatus Babeliales bacterium]
MSKSSKSCKYTGHMHVMNKENHTKEDFSADKAKSCAMQHKPTEQHCHHKRAYPEEQTRCTQCSCKNK